MRKTLLFILFLIGYLPAQSQLPDSCKLEIGTNLAGISDWGTELPFVDLMRNSREWYTKSQGDPNYPWNSEMAAFLSYRPDGYPTHVPQEIPQSIYPQQPATIWAITDSWPAGTYVVLWEGTGTLDFWGGYSNLQQTGSNRITFDFLDPVGNILEMIIIESDIDDPVHNIRVLMPGTEDTYLDQPFYDRWLELLTPFQTLRFMDWGHTNNWGQPDSWNWQDPSLKDWEDRAQMDYYTWTTTKGIPYEMMIRLMNEQGFDGWICVPHNASDDFMEQMAILFLEELDPSRHLFVEYSNETWNWIFGQAQWLNEYGCVQQNLPWPEGTVPYIQNCLDIWTAVFTDEPGRISRVAGGQTAWLDVYERTVYNLDPTSIDGITATYYFGLSGDGDAALDQLGSGATVADVAYHARQNMPASFGYIENIQTVADSLQKELVFYEGGQHLTPHPFGEIPTYEQALLDIHRDTAIYNLYNEWFAALRTLQEGDSPLRLMNFSFIAGRSAQYGSWGLLEFMDQDTSVIPAPKYQAVLENSNYDCQSVVSGFGDHSKPGQFLVFPNPAQETLRWQLPADHLIREVRVLDIHGRTMIRCPFSQDLESIPISHLPKGTYVLHWIGVDGLAGISRFIKM